MLSLVIEAVGVYVGMKHKKVNTQVVCLKQGSVRMEKTKVVNDKDNRKQKK